MTEHNVHEVLDVARDLLRRSHRSRRTAYLSGSVVSALGRHASLHPAAAGHEGDPVLRWMAELDDPAGRRVAPSGAFNR